MPAIIDPDGPDGAPISIFESGAILQYLARKTGQFGGATERDRIAVDQWLIWQMGGVGPMAGQCHHFLKYAPQMGHGIPYAKDRYRNETGRLYAVLDRQLAKHEYVAGDYSIADMAIWPWASLWEGQQQTLDDKPTWHAGWRWSGHDLLFSANAPCTPTNAKPSMTSPVRTRCSSKKARRTR